MKHITENKLINLISSLCSEKERTKYLEHIKKCPSCANLYSEMTFISDHIKQIGIEQPSAKFTNDLMEKIHHFQKKQAFHYMPLISKKWWSIIVTIMLAVFYALIFASQTGTDFREENFSIISYIESLLPDLSIIQNISELLKPEVMIQFIMIIAACWVLIFIDGLIKKVFLKIVN
ncbi:MAG: hypothetical protein FVQ77_10205 [Cytophagales bacterium]|nr:hypothetical protein [Cytophagales bacterium]